jgi:hypothetical protein
MSDEPFDLTEFVKSFSLKATTSPINLDNEGLDFVWEYKAPTVDINMEFTADLETIKKLFPEQHKTVVKMKYRGRFWFDPASDVDAIMTDVRMGENSITAECIGTNITDLTDYRPLARFLRWILRR